MYPADARRAASPQAEIVRRLQPARARHKLSQPHCSLADGMFSHRGAEKYFLGWVTQKASREALHPEQSLLGRVGIPWGAGREWSRPCFAPEHPRASISRLLPRTASYNYKPHIC